MCIVVVFWLVFWFMHFGCSNEMVFSQRQLSKLPRFCTFYGVRSNRADAIFCVFTMNIAAVWLCCAHRFLPYSSSVHYILDNVCLEYIECVLLIIWRNSWNGWNGWNDGNTFFRCCPYVRNAPYDAVRSQAYALIRTIDYNF